MHWPLVLTSLANLRITHSHVVQPIINTYHAHGTWRAMVFSGDGKVVHHPSGATKTAVDALRVLLMITSEDVCREYERPMVDAVMKRYR